MSKAPRVEIEARLFVLSYLGERKQAGQLDPDLADRTDLRSDLLRLFPLERWHEQGLITEEQLDRWITQALALLSSPESDF
jgi:hypothetical protein